MVLARLVAFLLALVFLWAAVAKAARPRRWSETVRRFALPGPLRGPASVAVPLVEAAVAGLFFLGATRTGAALVLALSALFSVAILRAHASQGSRLPCGCFGSTRERDYRVLLARNAALTAAAASLLVFGRDVRGYPPAPAGDAWPAAVLAVVGAGLVLWLFAAVRSGIRRGTT